MPPVDSDMAEQTLKGEYDLGFLPATAKTKENKLRAMLVDKVAKFMVELGAGFSYVGKGLAIDVGGDEFEIDLLFYHVVLHLFKKVEQSVDWPQFREDTVALLESFGSKFIRRAKKELIVIDNYPGVTNGECCQCGNVASGQFQFPIEEAA